MVSWIDSVKLLTEQRELLITDEAAVTHCGQIKELRKPISPRSESERQSAVEPCIVECKSSATSITAKRARSVIRCPLLAPVSTNTYSMAAENGCHIFAGAQIPVMRIQ